MTSRFLELATSFNFFLNNTGELAEHFLDAVLNWSLSETAYEITWIKWREWEQDECLLVKNSKIIITKQK